MILKYAHYNCCWYWWFEDNLDKKYYSIPKEAKGMYGGTERDIRNYLKDMYPNVKLLKVIQFHETNNRRRKRGSRPVQVRVDRKRMIKETNTFYKGLE